MKKAGIIILLVLAVSAFIYFTGSAVTENKSVSWQSQVSPGKLSAAHSQLSANCASCHTAVKGVDDAKCISCHAESKELLQRQPTAFHATVGNCASCHAEHLGTNANLRVMNHQALAQIGHKILFSGEGIVKDQDIHVSAFETQLNCASCHSTKDKHVGLFGQDCASCHATTQWTISAFQHPSVRSIDCAQCHQAPPSHYMEHFSMISQKIAGQEKAQVNQCYSCHQTTSFNDIKGVGYYKHH